MNSVYTSNQMSKNLPLKKRRIYHDENQPTKFIRSASQEQFYPSYMPTPPSSPHIEFLRQRHAYLSNHPMHAPPAYYRSMPEQQYYGSSNQNEVDFVLDEHYRKSFMNNHPKCSGRCLTPDESSSSCSSSVGSIEEHFARSLAKFWPAVSSDERSVLHQQITESVVDDHFAKALGAKTWGKLKDRC